MKNYTLFIISLLSILSAYAGDYDNERVIKKSYAIQDGFELEIDSKHSNISINNWDKDCVSVAVTIYASSANRIKLDEIIHEVDVKFNKSQDYLGVQTIWGSTSSSILNDIRNLFGDHVLSLSYAINIPEYVELDIENKFGNITIDKIKGDLKIENNHGSIIIQEMKDAKSIDVSYGKLKIKKGEEVEISSKFSDVLIDEIEEADIESTSSEIEIEKIEKLQIKSLSDEIEIEEADEITINANLSEIEIADLKESLTCALRMGSLEVESISNGAREININGQFTDIELDFPEGANYQYDVSLEKGKNFLIPTNGNTLEEDNFLGEVHEYIGFFNKKEGTNVKVVAKQSYVQFGID